MLTRTILLLTALITPLASVDARHPLRTAGEAYREAVKDFERAVFRADDMGRSQRRLADALEDQSARVRNESRNLDDLPRLQVELQTAAALHAQIEQTILANPYAPSIGVLGPTWQHVVQTYDQVCAQVQSLAAPVYGGGYGGILDDRYSAGYAADPFAVPSVSPYAPTPYLAPSRLPAPSLYPAPIVPDCPPVYRRTPVGRHHIGVYLQR